MDILRNSICTVTCTFNVKGKKTRMSKVKFKHNAYDAVKFSCVYKVNITGNMCLKVGKYRMLHENMNHLKNTIRKELNTQFLNLG